MTDSATSDDDADAQEKSGTWLDWLPSEAEEPPSDKLVTRTQLMDRLHALGIKLEPRTLMSWEAAGVLPRALRRWRDGRPQALYPNGWESAVYQVLDLQDHGYSLPQISDFIRRTSFAILTTRDWARIAAENAFQAIEILAHEVEQETGEPIWGFKVTMVDQEGEEVPGGFEANRIPIPRRKQEQSV